MKYSCILFIFHIALQNSFIQSSYLHKRNLIFNENLDNQGCNISHLNSQLPNESSSFIQYVNSFEDYKSPQPFILNILLEGTMSQLSEFVINIPGAIIFLTISACILITWIIMEYLWCCKCCLFNPMRKIGIMGYIYYGLSMTLFFGIFMSSLYSFAESEKFNELMNGSNCALMSFLDNTINGNKVLREGKWIGLIELQTILMKTNNSLKNVDIDRKKIYDADYYSDKTDYDNSYKETIEYLIQLATVIQDPNKYSGSINTAYGPSLLLTEPDSAINKIMNEKNSGVGESAIALDKLDIASKMINPNLLEIQQSLNDAQLQLENYNQLIKDMSNKLSTNYPMLLDKISQGILAAFKAINGLFFAFTCISLTVISIYVWSKLDWLKYGLHLLWNIMMLLTISCLIIGTILIIVGNIGYQMIPTLNYIFSSAYLDSSIFNPKGDSLKYLESCLNGDGDLSKIMGLKNPTNPFKYVYDYYNTTVKIHSENKIFNVIMNSPRAIDEFLEQLKEYQINIRSTAPDDYDKALKNAERICGEKYTFLLPTREQCIEFKTCFCIDDPIIPLNHNLESTPCSNEIKIIKTSIIENKENMNKITTSLIELQSTQNNLFFNQVKTRIALAADMTQELFDAYYIPLGDDDLYELFNCKVLRNDLIIFLDQFGNKYAKVSIAVGTGCVISAFFGFIGVLCFILCIYYFSDTARKIIDVNDAMKDFGFDDDIINKKIEIINGHKVPTKGKLEEENKKVESTFDIKKIHKEFEGSLRSNGMLVKEKEKEKEKVNSDGEGEGEVKNKLKPAEKSETCPKYKLYN